MLDSSGLNPDNCNNQERLLEPHEIKMEVDQEDNKKSLEAIKREMELIMQKKELVNDERKLLHEKKEVIKLEGKFGAIKKNKRRYAPRYNRNRIWQSYNRSHRYQLFDPDYDMLIPEMLDDGFNIPYHISSRIEEVVRHVVNKNIETVRQVSRRIRLSTRLIEEFKEMIRQRFYDVMMNRVVGAFGDIKYQYRQFFSTRSEVWLLQDILEQHEQRLNNSASVQNNIVITLDRTKNTRENAAQRQKKLEEEKRIKLLEEEFTRMLHEVILSNLEEKVDKIHDELVKISIEKSLNITTVETIDTENNGNAELDPKGQTVHTELNIDDDSTNVIENVDLGVNEVEENTNEGVVEGQIVVVAVSSGQDIQPETAVENSDPNVQNIGENNFDKNVEFDVQSNTEKDPELRGHETHENSHAIDETNKTDYNMGPFENLENISKDRISEMWKVIDAMDENSLERKISQLETLLKENHVEANIVQENMDSNEIRGLIAAEPHENSHAINETNKTDSNMDKSSLDNLGNISQERVSKMWEDIDMMDENSLERQISELESALEKHRVEAKNIIQENAKLNENTDTSMAQEHDNNNTKSMEFNTDKNVTEINENTNENNMELDQSVQIHDDPFEIIEIEDYRAEVIVIDDDSGEEWDSNWDKSIVIDDGSLQSETDKMYQEFIDDVAIMNEIVSRFKPIISKYLDLKLATALPGLKDKIFSMISEDVKKITQNAVMKIHDNANNSL